MSRTVSCWQCLRNLHLVRQFGWNSVWGLSLLWVLATVNFGTCSAADPGDNPLRFSRLPGLPDGAGVDGVALGTTNGVLLAAGGTTSILGAPSQAISILEDADGTWRTVGLLRQGLTASAATNWNGGVLLIGGESVDGYSRRTLYLEWRPDERQLAVTRTMPDLPEGCSSAAAAVLDGILYVVGGQSTLDGVSMDRSFWSLDLSADGAASTWNPLPPWDGPARTAAAVAAQDGALFMFGGLTASGSSGEDTEPSQLHDAYRYSPQQGWRRVADLPADGAARTAVPYGQSHLLVFARSGACFAYHTITDTWVTLNDVTVGEIVDESHSSPATFGIQGAVGWGKSIVLVGSTSLDSSPRSRVYQANIVESPRHFYTLDFLAVIIYLTGMVLVGLYFSGRTKSTADFFLAGGRIPWWLAGIAIRATQISSIGLMAIPAKAFASNWVYLMGALTIPLVTPVVVYCYLPFFCRLKVTTAYEFLEARFDLSARLFGSAAFIVLQLGRVAIVMFLPALAVSAVTGINVYVCILAAGLICSVYTVLGGIEAVMWTDLVQEIILVGGPVYCLVIAIQGTDGGLIGFLDTANAAGKFHVLDWGWDPSAAVVWVALIGTSFINLSTYTADQAVVQRYLSTRNQSAAAQAMWLNAVFVIPWGLLVFTLGTALYTFYRSHPELMEIGVKTDSVVPLFMAYQLPPGLAGLVIAAIFAATMSTVDSGIHSMSTAIVNDFHGRLRPAASDKKRLLLARVLTVILGAFATAAAMLIATYDIRSLWDLFFQLVGLVGSGLAGLFFLGIFTRRASGPGALVGVGVSASVLYFVQNYTSLHLLLYSFVGVMTCVGTGYAASRLLFPLPPQKDLSGLTVHTRGGTH